MTMSEQRNKDRSQNRQLPKLSFYNHSATKLT